MRMIKVGKEADLLGVTIQTLYKWEETGGLLPFRKSKAGTRYYDTDNTTIAYSKVSGHDQKNDLVRQTELLGLILKRKICRIVLIHKDRSAATGLS